MKKIILIIATLLCVFACSTMKYNRTKLIKKYSSDYVFLLNGDTVDLKNFYFDKENIKSIKISRNNHNINILQKNKNTDFYSLCFFNDTIKIDNEYPIIFIVNGELVDKNCNNVKIEANSIKTVDILTYDKINLFHKLNNYIVIVTK